MGCAASVRNYALSESVPDTTEAPIKRSAEGSPICRFSPVRGKHSPVPDSVSVSSISVNKASNESDAYHGDGPAPSLHSLARSPSNGIGTSFRSMMSEALSMHGNSTSLHNGKDSTHKEPTLFCSETILEAGASFMENEEKRAEFAKFIKDGLWLDEIGRNSNFRPENALILPSEEDNTKDTEVLFDFLVPATSYKAMKHSLLGVDDEFESGKTNSTITASFRSGMGGGDSDKTQSATLPVHMFPLNHQDHEPDAAPVIRQSHSSTRLRRGSRDSEHSAHSTHSTSAQSSVDAQIAAASHGNSNSNSNSTADGHHITSRMDLLQPVYNLGQMHPGGLSAEDFHNDYDNVRDRNGWKPVTGASVSVINPSSSRAYADVGNSSKKENASSKSDVSSGSSLPSGGNSFSRTQMLSVLFTVLYPLFLNRDEIMGESMKYGEPPRFCYLNSEGVCKCPIPCLEPPTAVTADACIAQEVLLSTAAYFDEEKVKHVLARPRWMEQIPRAVDRCILGVSVCDARSSATGTATGSGGKSGFPIIYTNYSLQAQTGYSAKQFFGNTFHMLQGPDTEAIQIKRMQEALEKKQSVKLVLTNYRRNRSTYLNMLILKPVLDADGDLIYVIGITFDISRKDASLPELHQADTLLALLPMILASNESSGFGC
mmetsp:Transcript_27161/g.45501  ORF Transcript_27161/g.45501 Transcript_27161/m.45501 type:complete len:657 (+) Transcript_27161:42-2012(+)